MAAVPRLLVGLVLMATACSAGMRWGGGPVRLAAGVIAVAWTLTTVGELVTGLRAEPVIIGDVRGGMGLLVLAASFPTRWLWTMTLIEAAVFMLHAWSYGVSDTPTAVLVFANNVLASLILVVLVVAALQDRRARLASRPVRGRWLDRRV